jgi:hypothetical protein
MSETLQLLVKDLTGAVSTVEANRHESVESFHERVAVFLGLSCCDFGKFTLYNQGYTFSLKSGVIGDYDVDDGSCLSMKLEILGGIDFQHREGSKIGSGGQLSESQAAMERKERLRKLALETIDISKDPYFMRNHLGSYECKLCLTLHTNEGNYLAHTQGKRHQYNLGRRAAMDAKNAAPRAMVTKETAKRTVIRIGRPGYKVRNILRYNRFFSMQSCLKLGYPCRR